MGKSYQRVWGLKVMPIAALGLFHEDLPLPPVLDPVDVSTLPSFAWISATPFTVVQPEGSVTEQVGQIWRDYRMPILLGGGVLVVMLLMPKGRRRR